MSDAGGHDECDSGPGIAPGPLRVRGRTWSTRVAPRRAIVVPAGDLPTGSYRVSLTTADDPATWPTTMTDDVFIG